MKNIALALTMVLASAPFCYSQSGSAAITYGASGLSSLSFNGTQYLANGAIVINSVNFLNQDGSLTPGTTSGSFSFDPANNRTTVNLPWGSVTTSYSVAGNKVGLSIAIFNSSSQTLQSISLQPLGIRFPSTPNEFDGRDPIWAMNDGSPSAIRMTAGTNTLVLANDDVTTPLLTGFPGPTDGPANTVFPIRAETTGDPLVPSFVPLINRPIAPGATDVWHLSLRFGAATTPTKTLVSDVYQSFIQAKPYRLVWPDRRPIGQLVIGTSAAGWPTNPRGWLLDKNIDVTTPQGIAAFQARLLSWAANSVTVLKQMNAQGMVTWDIEGEQYPQPTTYIGDPTQLVTLAPEMAGVVDQYFKTFTQAGLRVGVCLRPQQLVYPPNGGPPVQTTVADPTQLLLTKLAYARNRWGATLFYIDSNGDPNYPMSPKFFDTVAAQFPDVLLMTEHQNDGYYAFSTPYDELRGGVNSTPQSVLDVYPSAASVLYIPDGDIEGNRPALQAAVKRGDILMFRGWYADPQNQEILSLYPPNGTAPPLPVITSPSNAATVSGTVAVSTLVSAPGNVAGVQYLIDGNPVSSRIAGAPFTYNLDTTSLLPGQHSIQAIASDPMGDQGFATVNVTVAGQQPAPPPPPLPPPSVSITNPQNGATVSGSVTISATVSSSNAIVSSQLVIDGGSPIPLTGPVYQYVWDTTKVPNSTHRITLIVNDSAGNSSSATTVVSVSNIQSPPTVTIASPSTGSTVTGNVPVVINATGTGSLSLQVTLDGSLLGTLTTAPYTLTWNTLQVANGAHTLNVSASDSYGGKSTASSTVIVQNQVPSTPDTVPPAIQLISPQNNSNVSGVTVFSANVTDNVGVAKVVFYVDGVLFGTAINSPYSLTFDSTTVSGGLHYLSAQAFDAAGNQASTSNSFSVGNSLPPTCGSTGIRAFVGCYYSDPALANLVSTRLDQDLNFDWGTGSPAPGVPSSNFSASWQGLFNFDGGNYIFNAVANGGYRLYVDGQLIQDLWSQNTPTNLQIQSALLPGTHMVTLSYHSASANEMKLTWYRQ